MKQVVVVGDLHLNLWKAFATGVGPKNTRFLKTLENLERSLRKAGELGCPWLQAGDWSHTIGFTQNPVMNYLIDVLRQFEKVPKFTVWGNHDGRSAGGEVNLYETTCGILQKAVPGLIVLRKESPIHNTGSLNIYGEGHQPDINLLAVRTLSGRADVGLFHQTVEGSVLPSGFSMDHGVPREWFFDHFNLTVVGDIHQPQIISEGNKRILVPGSLESHNFGDHGERGWWICSEVNDVWDCTMVPSTSPMFITVPNVSDVKQDGNFYRVTNPCDPSELPEGAVALVSPKTVVQERDAIKPGSSTADILQAWMRLNPVPDPKLYGEVGLALLTAEGPTTLRPVRLRSVTIKDFLCYGEQEFKIKDGVTLVLGNSRDFTSNGAGKTTLFDSIFWAIFGTTTKGVGADEVIRWGQEKCEVSLDFGDLLVRRTRTKSGAGGLEVWSRTTTPSPTDEIINWSFDDPQSTVRWGGGAKDLSEYLQKHLGLTAELYRALAYFSQSKLVLFSQATDSERKGMLSDLCGLDVYQKAATAARSQASDIEQEIGRVSLGITGRRQQAKEVEGHIARLKESLIAWEQTSATIRAENERIISTTTAEVQRVTELCNRVANSIHAHCTLKLGRVESHRPELIAFHQERAEASRRSLVNEYAEWKATQPAFPSEAALDMKKEEIGGEVDGFKLVVTALDEQVKDIQAAIKTTNREITDLRLQPDKCRTCGQPLDTSQKERMLSTAEFQLGRHKDKEAELLPKLGGRKAELLQAMNRFGQVVDLLSQRKAFESKDKDYRNLVDGTAESAAKMVAENVEREMKSLLALEENRWKNLLKNIERSVRSRTALLKTTISGAEKRISEIQRNPHEGELVIAKQESDLIHQEILEYGQRIEQSEKKQRALEFWGTGFSRAGIQSLLMEEVAVAFNQIRSLVFPTLTHGVYDVQFATTSATREGELREKTDFIIRYHGGLVSYESLSGGQRRRVDLGVMLTLSLAVSRTRNVSGVLGLLILDEVFGFLDEDGNAALFDTLVEISKVVPAIYAVTHNPTLASLFSNTMIVTQDSYGVSSIK